MNNPSHADVEDFLRRFRRGLVTLPADIREDLVEEVRSHLEERLGQGELDLASEFGAPEEYAAHFMTEQALSTAVTHGTSVQLISALMGKVRTSALVIFVVLPLTMFQLIALALVGIGVFKPFIGGSVGLFLHPDGAFGGLGWISDLGAMHEVLGYAAIPVFIFGGLLLFWVANRLLLRIARRELAQLRARGR